MSLMTTNNKLHGVKRCCFISDLHFGVHQDSPMWHDIAIKFGLWLRDTLKKQKVKDIVIAGDVFHNRHEIGVNTLHIASRFFDILEDFNIIALVGNHDARQKHSSDVNSISILKNSNIHVVENMEYFNTGAKTLCLASWGCDVSNITPVDYLVGHFEISNFRVGPNRICDFGIETNKLLENATYVISGHFHYREQRFYDSSYILYLGSPYQLDFGDRDTDRGISIIDFETSEVTYINNTLSPKHKYIHMSDILDGKYTKEALQEEIRGNIVSVYVNKSISMRTIDLLFAKFMQYEPLQLKTDLDICSSIEQVKTTEALSIDIDTALKEFVSLIETDVPKNDILQKCVDLYKLSSEQHE